MTFSYNHFQNYQVGAPGTVVIHASYSLDTLGHPFDAGKFVVGVAKELEVRPIIATPNPHPNRNLNDITNFDTNPDVTSLSPRCWWTTSTW